MKRCQNRINRFLLFTAVIVIPFLGMQSCKTKIESESSLAVADFSGIQAITYSDNNTFTLEWYKPISSYGKVTYEIYIQELPEADPEADVVSVVNGRPVLALTGGATNINIQPRETGTLAGTAGDGDTSFTFTEPFENTKIYAFQVISVNEEGAKDENNAVLILSATPKVLFKGCLDYKSTETSIQINFEFPEKASKVNIYRDGQVVFTSNYSDVTTFVDENLAPAQKHTYICEALIGNNDKWVGSNSIEASTLNPLDAYRGCLKGVALGANHIRLTIEVLPKLDSIKVFRNGKEVLRKVFREPSKEAGEITFDDRDGLQESLDYSYQCFASVGGTEALGSMEQKVTTLSTNPPDFGGLDKVEKLTANSVKLIWGVTTGVPTKYYQIFYNYGGEIDWDKPVFTIESSQLEATIENLGDENTYSFAVKACSYKDVCDINSKVIVITLDDGGAPKPSLIEKIEKVDNNFYLHIPWKHENGAVKYRQVLRLTGDESTAIADYIDYGIKGLEFETTRGENPPDVLLIGRLEAFQTYHFVVRDYDRKGQVSPEFTPFKLTVGDLSAPIWVQGLLELNSPPPPENQEEATTTGNSAENSFIAVFDGTDEKTIGEAGDSRYIVLINELGSLDANLSTAASACNEGEIHSEYPLTDFPSGKKHELVIGGLKSRTYYSVCMKIRDKAGNISETYSQIVAHTKDQTPPDFGGLQAVYVDQKKIKISWNPPKAEDLDSYVVKFWIKGSEDQAVTFSKELGSDKNLASIQISPTDYDILKNGGDLEVLLNACDNYGQYESGKTNCTQITESRLLPDLKDFSPPESFFGITTVQRGIVEGQLIVHWINAIDLSDFFGFRIYEVENGEVSENSLGQCTCANNSCEQNPITSCTLDLTPGKGYRLLARPFDLMDNEATELSEPFPTVYAPDKTDPVFPQAGSDIKGIYDKVNIRNSIQFKLATDNQFNKSPDAIEYKIYRSSFIGECTGKSTSDIETTEANFLTSHIAASDAVGVTVVHDSQALESSTSYLYRVVAVDQFGLTGVADSERNSAIDSSFACVTTGDIIPPEFVGGQGCPQINKAKGCPTIESPDPDAPRWALSWNMIDPLPGGTAKGSMKVKIYRAYTDSDTPPEIGNDLSGLSTNYTFIHTGTGLTRYPEEQSEYTEGPAGMNTWVHYAVVIADLDKGIEANRTVATASIYSQNKVEITTITRNHGTHLGGKLIMIKGTGFTASTEIFFSDKDKPENKCLNTKLIKTTNKDDPRQTDRILMCTTPAWTLPVGQIEEKVRLWIVRELGSPVLSAQGVEYTFYDPGETNIYNGICDDPTAYAKAPFANTPDNPANEADFGIEDNPYIICSRAQLAAIKTADDPAKTYYKLQDNIDLSDSTWNTLATVTGTIFNFDGDNHALYGLQLDIFASKVPGYPHYFIGLFQFIGKDVEISNLSILDAKILDNNTAPSSTNDGSLSYSPYIGVLGGYLDSPSNQSSNIKNITIQATLEAVNDTLIDNGRIIGGMIGRASVAQIDDISMNLASDGRFQYVTLGGVVGAADMNPEALTIKNSSIQLKSTRLHYNMGGVVAYNVNEKSLTVDRVKVNLNVINDDFETVGSGNFGGILGYSYHGAVDNSSTRTISNVEVYGSMNAGQGKPSGYAGGIAGELHGAKTIIDHALVQASLTATYGLGGFVGQSFRFHTDSYEKISLDIKNSRFSGELHAQNFHQHSYAIGGFIGRSMIYYDEDKTTVKISDSIFDGKIIAHNENGMHHYYSIGGIIGIQGEGGYIPQNLLMENVAVLGSISIKGNSSHVGGAFGIILGSANDFDETSIIVRKSYIAPKIEMNGKTAQTGGAVGTLWGSPLEIENTLVETQIFEPAVRVGGLIAHVANADNDDPVIKLKNVLIRTKLKDLGANASRIYGVIGEDYETGDIVYEIDQVFFDLDQTNPDLTPIAFQFDSSYDDHGRTAEQLNTQQNFNGSWVPETIWTWDNGKPELVGIINLLSTP